MRKPVVTFKHRPIEPESRLYSLELITSNEMFALGQNWAELKHDYYAEVFPSASIFKGRKWQKITNTARKKL